MTRTKVLFSYPKLILSSSIISIIYGVIYYFSAGFIVITPVEDLDLMVLGNWTQQAFRLRGPFLWEPIGVISLPPGLQVYLSIPNLMLGLILMLLVFGNVLVVLIGMYHPKVCRITRKGTRLASLVPALFTGFGCCAPTIAIIWVGIVGSISTSALIFMRWLLPIGLVLLIHGFFKGMKAIRPENEVAI
jgi:hypothetical protein